MLEAVRAVHMPHVPQLRAEVLRHPDAVAIIHARRGVEHRFGFEELRFHVGVAFEAAAGKHHAPARLDVAFAASGRYADTAHFARLRIGNELQRRSGETDFDVMLQ